MYIVTNWLQREHKEKCREFDQLKRATVKLKEDMEFYKSQLEERDRLIQVTLQSFSFFHSLLNSPYFFQQSHFISLHCFNLTYGKKNRYSIVQRDVYLIIIIIYVLAKKLQNVLFCYVYISEGLAP